MKTGHLVWMMLMAVCITISCKDEVNTNNCHNTFEDLYCVRYSCTYCADPWPQDVDSDAALLESARTFLESRQIFIHEFRIEHDHSPASCLACSCRDGRTMYGVVGPLNLNEIVDLGFEQY